MYTFVSSPMVVGKDSEFPRYAMTPPPKTPSKGEIMGPVVADGWSYTDIGDGAYALPPPGKDLVTRFKSRKLPGSEHVGLGLVGQARVSKGPHSLTNPGSEGLGNLLIGRLVKHLGWFPSGDNRPQDILGRVKHRIAWNNALSDGVEHTGISLKVADSGINYSTDNSVVWRDESTTHRRLFQRRPTAIRTNGKERRLRDACGQVRTRS